MKPKYIRFHFSETIKTPRSIKASKFLHQNFMSLHCRGSLFLDQNYKQEKLTKFKVADHSPGKVAVCKYNFFRPKLMHCSLFEELYYAFRSTSRWRSRTLSTRERKRWGLLSHRDGAERESCIWWLGVDRNDSERERLGLMLHVMVNYPDVGGLVSCILYINL